MSVKFSEAEAALIDAARGAESRSEWLREVALGALRAKNDPQDSAPGEDESPVISRFRLLMDMNTTGIWMYRQHMRRENPDASDEEVEALVQSWLARPRDEPEDQPRRLSGEQGENHATD
jgi:hypothetical protein